MSQLKHFISLALRMPIHKAFIRFISFSIRVSQEYVYKQKRLLGGRFSVPKMTLHAFPKQVIARIDTKPEIIKTLIKYYLNHRFDLLGSGWIRVGYSDKALGIEGHKYSMNLDIPEFDIDGKWLKHILKPRDLKYAQQIWQQIEDQNYLPIDWQKDYKSGFRWGSNIYFKDCRENIVGIKPGVDIKVPWELSRLQHLPQMAVIALEYSEKRNILLQEFRNQILDFIATNPAQMGVCWTCTMDVAIRVTNIIIAFNQFKQIDKNKILDTSFESILTKSIYEHGKHIFDNLEWHYEFTSNHYLANIAGLLFVASFLENNPETNLWLCFAANELIKEFNKQFYNDGSSCEASTSYHRLSGEMMIYSTALLLGLSASKTNILKEYQKYNVKLPKRIRNNSMMYTIEKQKLCFPNWFSERLLRMVNFTVNCTKQNGNVVQIGDNDSGRFIKLTPVGEFKSVQNAEKIYLNLKGYSETIKPYSNATESFWDEQLLNHSTLLLAANELFEGHRFTPNNSAEGSLIKVLSNERKLNVTETPRPKFTLGKFENNTFQFKKENVFISEKSIEKPKLIEYPNFGLVILKSSNLFLSISIGHKAKQYCNWGHSHNDKLAVELTLNEKYILLDPGTYLYTPLKNKRLVFASTQAHNTCHFQNLEQTDFTAIFTVKPNYTAQVIKLNAKEIILQITYKNIVHKRQILLSEKQVSIVDYSNHPIEQSFSKFPYFSEGYGKISEKLHV